MLSFRKTTQAAVLLTVLTLLLTACGGPQLVRPEMEATARALLAQGRFVEAANEYLRLAADSRPPASDEFAVKAAAALVDGGDVASARRVLEQLLSPDPGVGARTARDVLMARIALVENDPEAALARLPPGTERGVGAALARLIHELRGEALEKLGRFLEVAAERVALSPLLQTPEAIEANHIRIWQAVTRLSPPELMQARLPPPNELGGWLELAEIANRSVTDPMVLAGEIANWRLSFPDHPAEQAVIPELRRLAEMGTAQPGQVALLLPLHGPFANAGGVIRDGFMAAWLDDRASNARPVITVHDSSETDIVALYHRVVDEGAQFVVGPLQKQAVSQLAAHTDLPVPVLALNYAEPADAVGGTDTAAAAGEGSSVETLAVGGVSADSTAAATPLVAAPMYQFSLSPENEAAAVAERAWFDGIGRAALITPASPLGNRIAAAFVERWETLGGLLVARQIFEDDARDLSGPIEQLLNIDRSQERLQRLREVIGRGVKHASRRRQDVDMVFTTGTPTQARLLKPQLNFHHAGDIPVFATSHVYGAQPNPEQDMDVEGVRFGDMPWVLPDAGRDLNLRQQVSAAFPTTPARLNRLYAFGVDAYRLIPHLGRLRAQPYASIAGATGDLSVDDRNRVARKLVWAHFVDGQPRLLDTGGGMLP